VTDWSDDHEHRRPSWAARESSMRLYIVVGLIGMGALGVIGGLFHVLPA
jgi:hypothetical protein